MVLNNGEFEGSWKGIDLTAFLF